MGIALGPKYIPYTYMNGIDFGPSLGSRRETLGPRHATFASLDLPNPQKYVKQMPKPKPETLKLQKKHTKQQSIYILSGKAASWNQSQTLAAALPSTSGLVMKASSSLG